MIEMAEEEDDESLAGDIEEAITNFSDELESVEIQTLLSGPRITKMRS